MGNSAKTNTPIPKQTPEPYGTWKTEEPKFLKPVLTDELPIFRPYCGEMINGTYKNTNCRDLQRLLFRKVNYDAFGNDLVFQSVTRSSLDDDDWEIKHNVKDLMKDKESSSTMYNTVQSFKAVCQGYRASLPKNPVLETPVADIVTLPEQTL